MDLIIKNLDHLGNYHNGHNVPIGKVVLDFDKLGKDDFAQIFFSACKKYDEYDEVEESYLQGVCRTCRYDCSDPCEEPCNSCIQSDEMSPNWKPKEPNLKEVTERMQSEFDATGIDTKIFMNGRVIKR